MPNTIVLAIDDSPFSRAAADEIAQHMRPDDTTVHVLHVLELDRVVPPPYDFARGTGYGEEVMAHVQQHHVAAEHLVSEAADRLRTAGFQVSVVIREGEPRHAILDYAAASGCDCIVVGSHGRREIDRFFMGSVSDAVARHAHCSVHIVRMKQTGGAS